MSRDHGTATLVMPNAQVTSSLSGMHVHRPGGAWQAALCTPLPVCREPSHCYSWGPATPHLAT